MSNQEPQIRKIAQLSGHSGPVFALTPGSKKETVFTGSADRFLAEWNILEPAAEKFSVKLEAPVYSLCNIEDAGILVIGLGTGHLHVIDLKAKKEIKHIIHHQSAIFDIQYHPMERLIYTAGGDGLMCVWKADDFKLLASFPLSTEKIRQVAIAPDGKSIAVACGDSTVQILDTNAYNPLVILDQHSMSANAVHFSKDGKWLITGGKDAWIHFFKVDGGFSHYKGIPAHNYAVYSFAEHPELPILASASRDKTVKLWDLEDPAFLVRLDRKEYQGHLNSVNKVLWTPCENRLVSTGDDRSIIIWGTE